jgi:nonribosomal peptide synthetase DhbF
MGENMDAVPDIQSLLDLCAEVIGVPAVAADAAFYDAGGDSASAARLVILMEERWGLDLDIFTVIATDSLDELHAGLVAAVRDRGAAGRPL